MTNELDNLKINKYACYNETSKLDEPNKEKVNEFSIQRINTIHDCESNNILTSEKILSSCSKIKKQSIVLKKNTENNNKIIKNSNEESNISEKCESKQKSNNKSQANITIIDENIKAISKNTENIDNLTNENQSKNLFKKIKLSDITKEKKQDIKLKDEDFHSKKETTINFNPFCNDNNSLLNNNNPFSNLNKNPFANNKNDNTYDKDSIFLNINNNFHELKNPFLSFPISNNSFKSVNNVYNKEIISNNYNLKNEEINNNDENDNECEEENNKNLEFINRELTNFDKKYISDEYFTQKDSKNVSNITSHYLFDVNKIIIIDNNKKKRVISQGVIDLISIDNKTNKDNFNKQLIIRNTIGVILYTGFFNNDYFGISIEEYRSVYIITIKGLYDNKEKKINTVYLKEESNDKAKDIIDKFNIFIKK